LITIIHIFIQFTLYLKRKKEIMVKDRINYSFYKNFFHIDGVFILFECIVE